MTREEKADLIGTAVKQLAGDDRFQLFMVGIEEMKMAALRDAGSDATLASPGATAAAIGEVRAYLDIQDLVKEHSEAEVVSTL
jgi:hypothetical protein